MTVYRGQTRGKKVRWEGGREGVRVGGQAGVVGVIYREKYRKAPNMFATEYRTRDAQD